MSSCNVRLLLVLTATLVAAVAFQGTEPLEAGTLAGQSTRTVNGKDSLYTGQRYAASRGGGIKATVTPGVRSTSPSLQGNSETIRNPVNSGIRGVKPPNHQFNINIGPGPGRHYPRREFIPEATEIPEDPWEDDSEEEKPKSKKKAAPPSDAPQKPKGATAATKAKPPEDKGGVVHARRFLLTNAIGFPLELALQVWANPVNSEKSALEAVKQARQNRQRYAELQALRHLGSVYYWLGLFPQAAQNLKAAIDLSMELVPAETDPMMLSVGGLQCAAGEYDQAVDSFDEVIISASRSDNKEVVAAAHLGKALISKKKDRPYEALHELKLAANVAPDAKSRARVLTETGATFALLRQFQLAEENLKKARQEAQNAHDTAREQEVQLQLAELYIAWGKPDDARNELLPAVRMTQNTKPLRNYVQKVIADVYMDSGQLHKAIAWAEASADPSCLGRLELLKGDYKKAAVHYQQLAKNAQKNDQSGDFFAAYTGLGKVAEATGNKGQAEQHYKKAMDAADKMREELLLSERASFFSMPCDGFKPSEGAKGVTRIQLMTKGKAASVLPSEFIRARCFADKIALAAQPPGDDVPPHVLETEKSLMERLASLQKRKGILAREADPARYDQIVKEIKAVEKELKDFMATVSSKYKEYAAIRHPKPIDVQQAALAQDEHVLFLDALNQGVGIRLIQGNKVVSAAYVPWDEADLNKEIRSFLAQFSFTPDGTQLKSFDAKQAKRIYAKLLSGVLGSLQEGTPLTIIPDETLALIPFEALVVGGEAHWSKERWGERPEGLQFLGDKYPISYCSSLTVLTFSRHFARDGKVGDRYLVVANPVFDLTDPRAQDGNPAPSDGKDREFYVSLMTSMEDGTNIKFKPLPETGSMASELRELRPENCDVLTGLEASKAHFLDTYGPKLGQYRWVVFGTHGILSDQVPGIREPSLVLCRVPPGTDGFLKMSDIVGLNVQADVVALTACQTGVGNVLTGEGVQGMGRAFQYAGAKSVLMSLWSVSEKASVRLTESFFKEISSGKSQREALKQARSALRENGYDHPFFWAAFVLVGEADQTRN